MSGAREQLDAATERLSLAEQEVAQARDRFNAGVAGKRRCSERVTRAHCLAYAGERRRDGVQLARVALARATGSVTTLR